MDQAQLGYQKGQKETGSLEQDLQVAIKKDRDNIARMLIKKLKPLSRLQSERRNHIDRMNHEIDQFKAYIEQQRIQYEQLRQKATEFFYRKEKQKWEPLWPASDSGLRLHELSEEEVELELLQRKEELKGGVV
jgi:phage shock protein A